MTAVFAFAQGDIIMVFGDTLRGGTSTVSKLHDWNDTVLLAHSGSAALSRLIACMRAGQPQFPDFSVAFNQYRSIIRQQCIERTKVPAACNGTILLTELAQPSITAFDFATGSSLPLVDNIVANGENPDAFTDLAKKHFATIASTCSTGNMALDEWAKQCVGDAIQLYPATVGWPAEALIARPDGLGGRIIVRRRIDWNTITGHHDFMI